MTGADTAVTVVVPWRGGCEWRERAWTWMAHWWAVEHPGWEVILAEAPDSGGAWCKAAAVTAALPRAGGGVLVVADADVVCGGVGEAVAEVVSGRAAWAVPHRSVYRLTPSATEDLYDGGALPNVLQPRSLLRGTLAEVHRGVQGGGITVLTRRAWDGCPLDARFTGWGQEDLAWGWALWRMAGAPYTGAHPLIHLWHPPQARASRVAGSTDSMTLWDRYRHAYTAAEVAALLAEPGARLH